jgi:hypothetical protein
MLECLPTLGLIFFPSYVARMIVAVVQINILKARIGVQENLQTRSWKTNGWTTPPVRHPIPAS